MHMNNVYPELFPVIAAHLPLHVTPSTLLALALTNRRLHDILIPSVLNSIVILKNESHALSFLHKMLANPFSCLAHRVRELHIMTELSGETRTMIERDDGQTNESFFHVIGGLERLMETGGLANTQTLQLRLLDGWESSRDIGDGAGNPYHVITGLGYLRSGFQDLVAEKCPRLNSFSLGGVREYYCDLWVDDSGLYEIQGLRTLSLNLQGISHQGIRMLMTNLSSSLVNLALELSFNTQDWQFDFSYLSSFDFPVLKTLYLSGCTNCGTSISMDFWHRHPSLENIDLIRSVGGRDLESPPWFSDDIKLGFLPNLKHLKAKYIDVWRLVPILGQLISLSIENSFNAQIPYILRVVFPNGLPNLRSLYINQTPSGSSVNCRREGAKWYEDEEGQFISVIGRKEASRQVDATYIASIARGAPNLVEIRLKPQLEYGNLIPSLAAFKRLERFSFQGPDRVYGEEPRLFLSEARDLANVCPHLISVTNVKTFTGTHQTVRIRRDVAGNVQDVVAGTGFGMDIGNEQKAWLEEFY